MPIMSKLTAAYLAGLIDGEGYLGFTVNKSRERTSYQPVMKVAMTDEKIIRWLQSSFGGSFFTRTPDNPKHKISYWWDINGKNLKAILFKINPYLRLKKPQCEILLKKFKIQEQLFKQLPYPQISQVNEGREEKRISNLSYREDQREKIEELYLQIRSLNKKGRIDSGSVID